MKAPPPQLRLIAEINRVARLALGFQDPFKEEVACRLFTTSPVHDRDRPGFLDRLFIPRRNRMFSRPYGDLLRLDRYPFFSTRPVGFTAIALPDGRAAVAFRAGSTATLEDVQAWVRNRIAAYKYPRHLWVVETLPKGPTGKILRREVHKPADS